LTGLDLMLQKKSIVKYTPAKLLSMYKEWEYDIESSDWINPITGELLTDYKLPSRLQAILNENINLVRNYTLNFC
jgi:hypothetical protein